jgi:hypothetical protein
MTALKSPAFTALPKRGNDPVLNRRAKVIARLEEQKQLLADPNFIRVTPKWTKKDGERVQYDKMSIGVGSGPRIGVQKGPPRFTFRAISVRPVGAGRGCGDGASAG